MKCTVCGTEFEGTSCPFCGMSYGSDSIANADGSGDSKVVLTVDDTVDPKFEEAIQIVVDAGQASTALLQRRLKLNYTRAAQIIDQLEQYGVIGPYRGAQPRDVLIASSSNSKTDGDASAFSIDVSPPKSNRRPILSYLPITLRWGVRSILSWIFHPGAVAFYILTVYAAITDPETFSGGVFENLGYFICGVSIIRGIYELATFGTPKGRRRSAKRAQKKKEYFEKHCKEKEFFKGNHEELLKNSNFFSEPPQPTVRPTVEVIRRSSARPSNPKPESIVPNPISSLESIDSMDGHQFEYFCADLLRKNGFEQVEVTQASGDYGIDVLAEKDGVSYAIQCKCYSGNVGNHAVQEAHSGASYYNRMVAVVMTNSYFTEAAKETARRTQVLLWDRDKLMQMQKS